MESTKDKLEEIFNRAYSSLMRRRKYPIIMGSALEKILRKSTEKWGDITNKVCQAVDSMKDDYPKEWDELDKDVIDIESWKRNISSVAEANKDIINSEIDSMDDIGYMKATLDDSFPQELNLINSDGIDEFSKDINRTKMTKKEFKEWIKIRNFD